MALPVDALISEGIKCQSGRLHAGTGFPSCFLFRVSSSVKYKGTSKRCCKLGLKDKFILVPKKKKIVEGMHSWGLQSS